MKDEEIYEVQNPHDCPNWNADMAADIQERYLHELTHGGAAFGANDQERLVGFGVLANQFRGINSDTLQVVLMYVSNGYRRMGIGKRLMDELKTEAARRGAVFLYVSSTETVSAVNFYKSCGSFLTREIDQQLFELEPEDIHMRKIKL
jgi:ribosomal protein S18 acetylase RimI-like enzyme